ncbi:hypothetical protein Nepgr_014470 [Nepenthes gracilis]|uniref:Uncharacterized protein n=1 Tax=Nepenthes gracilis TaxID=150966 RepID=A0AAD3XQ60_NEPGR|nr:hypothetical protein Nepgr_014470 [Nepenthes gracilis]
MRRELRNEEGGKMVSDDLEAALARFFSFFNAVVFHMTSTPLILLLSSLSTVSAPCPMIRTDHLTTAILIVLLQDLPPPRSISDDKVSSLFHSISSFIALLSMFLTTFSCYILISWRSSYFLYSLTLSSFFTLLFQRNSRFCYSASYFALSFAILG